MAKAPKGRRPLLRRRLWALGAALTRKAAADRALTRSSASANAAAGFARAVGGHGEAAIPASKSRAPAVAIVVVISALCCCSLARADDAPPPATTPTSTTPNAPPPDPYHQPAPQPKPKPKQTAPTVVHSAPVRSYTPSAPAVPVRTSQPRQTVRPRPAKAVHKRKARVVHPHVAPKPKPVKVTFNPFANFVAASTVLGTTEDTGDRNRYLWLAGLAFAALALAGLSLQVLAVRTVE